MTTATNDHVVLKIRYDSVPILNHKSPDATNPSILDWTQQTLNSKILRIHGIGQSASFSESCAPEDADRSGHTPRYIDYTTQKQTTGKPYLNGYNHLLLMSSIPGVDSSMICDGLPEDDLEIIQTQMTRTLEWITPVFVLNHTLNIWKSY